METDLVASALHMASTQRQQSRGLLHHTDQGSQYAPHDYQKLLRAHHMSMSRKGERYDNAVIESFWSTLKTECATRVYASRLEARRKCSELGCRGVPPLAPCPSPLVGEGALLLLSAQGPAPDGVTGFSPLSLHGRRA